MCFEQYEEHIREQLELVTALHMSDATRSRAICEQLLTTGQVLQDDALMGFAYYYLAESYFVDNQYQPFVSNLILGLEHQLQASSMIFLAKSYNMLGISATYSATSPMWQPSPTPTSEVFTGSWASPGWPFPISRSRWTALPLPPLLRICSGT